VVVTSISAISLGSIPEASMASVALAPLLSISFAADGARLLVSFPPEQEREGGEDLGRKGKKIASPQGPGWKPGRAGHRVGPGPALSGSGTAH
jgi:hypothetical protein